MNYCSKVLSKISYYMYILVHLQFRFIHIRLFLECTTSILLISRRLKLPCTIPDVLTLYCTLYHFLKDKYVYSEHLGTLSRYNNSLWEKGIDKTITHNLLPFRSSILDILSIINMYVMANFTSNYFNMYFPIQVNTNYNLQEISTFTLPTYFPVLH
jgi:hypothetical protein